MTFKIFKTSDPHNYFCEVFEQPIPPCKNAKLIDRDTFNNLDIYHVELNSLEDLIALQKEVNEPIIFRWYRNESDIPELEIYDTFRE